MVDENPRNRLGDLNGVLLVVGVRTSLEHEELEDGYRRGKTRDGQRKIESEETREKEKTKENEPWKNGVNDAGTWLTRYLKAFPFLVLIESSTVDSLAPSGRAVARSEMTSSGTPIAVLTFPLATSLDPGVLVSMMATTAAGIADLMRMFSHVQAR